MKEIQKIFENPTEEKIKRINEMLKYGWIDYPELCNCVEYILNTDDYDLMALLVKYVYGINNGRIVGRISKTRNDIIIYKFLRETLEVLNAKDLRTLAKGMIGSKKIERIYYFARELVWSCKVINGERVKVIDILGEDALEIIDYLAAGLEKHIDKEEAFYIFYFLRDIGSYISIERKKSLITKANLLGDLRTIIAVSRFNIFSLREHLKFLLNGDKSNYRYHDLFYIFAKENYEYLKLEEENEELSFEEYSLTLIAKEMLTSDDYLMIYNFLKDVPSAPYKDLVDKLFKMRRNNDSIVTHYLICLAEGNYNCSSYVVDLLIAADDLELLDTLIDCLKDELLKRKVEFARENLCQKLGEDKINQIRGDVISKKFERMCREYEKNCRSK